MKRTAIGALVVLLIAAGGLSAANNWVNNKGQASGKPVSIDISHGSSGSAIASALESKGVIPSALSFRVYLKLHKVNAGLRAGKYQLRENMPYEEVVAKLRKGPAVKFVRLVIPEGFTIDQTAEQVGKLTHIKAADFLAAAVPATATPRVLTSPPPSLEGFLYPSTYYVTEKETAQSLVVKLVKEFDKRAASVGLDDAAKNGTNPYDIVNIASMVEQEAKAPEERARIAGVIMNRLTKHIPLGIDATIQYAVKKYHGEPLTQSDLDSDSPYNSRKFAGLPPTPIASPGAASLKAALQPEKVDFLYYVLTADCVHHLFTANYAEFERARQQQPRDC